MHNGAGREGTARDCARLEPQAAEREEKDGVGWSDALAREKDTRKKRTDRFKTERCGKKKEWQSDGRKKRNESG
jgi:hypothetical protein